MSLQVAGFTEVVPLDSGGFGSVYRAVRSSTGGIVALKQLDRATDVTEELVERRLRREIAALVALKGHPDVVQVEEMIVTDGGPVIVMEYMDGGSVAGLLGSTSPPLTRIAEIGAHVANALTAAHSAGIVHRDVKPQNVLLNGFGQVKLCDFGIAAVLKTAEAQTRTTSLSVRYASPEELDDAPDVGPPTDVYSLGATLFHLLHGEPPSFRRRNEPTVDDTVVGPGSGPRVTLNRIVDECLQTDASARPTAGDLHGWLTDLTSANPSDATIRRAAPTSAAPMFCRHCGAPNDDGARYCLSCGGALVAGAVSAATQPARATASLDAGRPHRVPWGLALAAVLLLGGGAVAWVMFGRSTDEPSVSARAESERAASASSTMADSPDPTTAPPVSAPAAVVVPVTAAVEPLTTTTTTTTTLPPTTTSPPTTAPPPTAAVAPAALSYDEAVTTFDRYLAAVVARRYDEGWSYLTQPYQTKYLGYDNFVDFWETVDGAGVRSVDSLGGNDSLQTLGMHLYFGRRDDGTISEEIVEVDLVRTVDGRVLIDDYRYIGSA